MFGESFEDMIEREERQIEELRQFTPTEHSLGENISAYGDISVDGCEVKSYKNQGSIFIVNMESYITPDICPHCGGTEFSYSHNEERECTDIPIRKNPTIIHLSYPIVRCKTCKKKSFKVDEEFPKGRRFTRRALVFITSPLNRDTSNSALAKEMGVGEASIRRIRKTESFH